MVVADVKKWLSSFLDFLSYMFYFRSWSMTWFSASPYLLPDSFLYLRLCIRTIPNYYSDVMFVHYLQINLPDTLDPKSKWRWMDTHERRSRESWALVNYASPGRDVTSFSKQLSLLVSMRNIEGSTALAWCLLVRGAPTWFCKLEPLSTVSWGVFCFPKMSILLFSSVVTRRWHPLWR